MMIAKTSHKLNEITGGSSKHEGKSHVKYRGNGYRLKKKKQKKT